MVRRVSASLCAVLVIVLFGAVLGSALPAATAQESLTQETPTATSYVDADLHQALIDADLVAVWVEASGISAEASLVEVVGDEAYRIGRQELLNELDRLTERLERSSTRAENADRLTNDVEALEVLVRSLRREISVSAGRSAAVSLRPDMAEAARATLATISGTTQWIGLSLDPLTLAEHRLITARDEVQRELDGLNRVGQNQKSFEISISRFTAVNADLARVRRLIDTESQRSIVKQFEYVAHRAAVVETLPELHRLRVLRPTSVGGLPVVTLDAYVQGADALDDSCPVDWALLAGIGRVESRHGTINDTQVQSSGRLTTAILGPLLDGGATAREAAQAAEAEAAEALLRAEPDPEEPEPEFDESLWGDAVERAKELDESAAAGREAVGLAAPPAPEVDEEPPPRYDPLLWGNDLPFDEGDLDDDEIDETVDEDEEEPEFKGNGFAVIADSDNGRLDGNSRWDRAVGPMQFIPETWSYWETDGNDDGVIDPQNMYDAAATAGRFLCHLSRTRGLSPHSFVLGYNSSETYVRNVMAVADAFGASALPTVPL